MTGGTSSSDNDGRKKVRERERERERETASLTEEGIHKSDASGKFHWRQPSTHVRKGHFFQNTCIVNFLCVRWCVCLCVCVFVCLHAAVCGFACGGCFADPAFPACWARIDCHMVDFWGFWWQARDNLYQLIVCQLCCGLRGFTGTVGREEREAGGETGGNRDKWRGDELEKNVEEESCVRVRKWHQCFWSHRTFTGKVYRWYL